jgi:hypothetical protein
MKNFLHIKNLKLISLIKNINNRFKLILIQKKPSKNKNLIISNNFTLIKFSKIDLLLSKLINSSNKWLKI